RTRRGARPGTGAAEAVAKREPAARTAALSQRISAAVADLGSAGRHRAVDGQLPALPRSAGYRHRAAAAQRGVEPGKPAQGPRALAAVQCPSGGLAQAGTALRR